MTAMWDTNDIDKIVDKMDREAKQKKDPMDYVFPLWTFIVGFVFGCYFGFVVM